MRRALRALALGSVLSVAGMNACGGSSGGALKNDRDASTEGGSSGGTGGNPVGAGGTTGGCTEAPDCGSCTGCLLTCICQTGDNAQCIEDCSGAGGAGGFGGGCSASPDCDGCLGCLETCICETGDPAQCASQCQGTGGTGGGPSTGGGPGTGGAGGSGGSGGGGMCNPSFCPNIGLGTPCCIPGLDQCGCDQGAGCGDCFGGGTGGGGAGGTGGVGTCNPAFCPSTFGTPCCLTANGPCGCDMGMGCTSCGGGSG